MSISCASTDEIHARPSPRGASLKTFCTYTKETNPPCSQPPMSSSRSIATAICPSAPFLVPRRACILLRNVHPVVRSVAAKHDAAHPRPGRPQTQSSFLRRAKSKQGRFVPPPVLDEDSGEVCVQSSRTRPRADHPNSSSRPSANYAPVETYKAPFAFTRICLETPF